MPRAIVRLVLRTEGGRGQSADSRQAKEEGRHILEEEQENPEEIARGRCPLPTEERDFNFASKC